MDAIAHQLLTDAVNKYFGGYMQEAKSLYQRYMQSNVEDRDMCLMMLANIERDTGHPDKALELLQHQLQNDKDNTTLRRVYLMSQQYSGTVLDKQLYQSAADWGHWAVRRAGGPRPRPRCIFSRNRKLHIGFVSADIYQHTVGLLIKDCLRVLRNRFRLTVYNNSEKSDWVTKSINKCATSVDIRHYNDAQLAAAISNDAVDILVDLSGHTARSRLSAFAYRPAPVMVSWLGYFATTGLEYIDALICDHWHITDETQFVEPLDYMTHGRLCYVPVPFVPELPKYVARDHIVFGSFNNTGKYNERVFGVWARILCALPNSRLVLKCRTFVDVPYCNYVRNFFSERGIDRKRIELRPASYHRHMLEEYLDVDIALDPFPFTGCLTSLEALYMGCPVITLPQNRMVSRQTHSILNVIGLPEFSAKNEDDYVHIAVALAKNSTKLSNMHNSMRDRMRASPLMDVEGFAQEFGDHLTNLYMKIAKNSGECAVEVQQKTVLHVGAGHRNNGSYFPPAFDGYKEIRLDIDPKCEPDVVCSMLDMKPVEDNSVDAIYSSHNIEHVHTHEVQKLLKEFLRVLKPSGFLLVTCPDLQSIGQMLADDKLEDMVYMSAAGPICPLDIIFGHAASVAASNLFMQHKTGFTKTTLIRNLHAAGFKNVAAKRRLRGYDLWALATKDVMAEEELRNLAMHFMP